MSEEAKRFADVILAALQLVAVILGGAWVFFRFRRESTHRPRVAFDIEGTFLGPQAGFHLAEFIMTVKNAGLVKHRFTKITLRVRGVKQDAPLGLWGATQRLEFPELVVDDADVMHQKKFGSIFVEPGVTQRLVFIARIPAEVRFIAARSEFTYDECRTHSAERLFDTRHRKNPQSLAPEAEKGG